MSKKDGQLRLSFSIDVPKGAQRLRELIVYISKKCEHDPWFGATKLNKILYHSDFRAFSRFGIPLTGMPYFRLPNGPAPRLLLRFRRDLEQEGAIEVNRISLPDGKEQHRTIAKREPVLEHFTADELQLVDQVIDDFWNQNGSEVSEASHDIRWKVLNNKDDLPYEFAFLRDEPISNEDVSLTRKLATEHGWLERYGR